MERKEAGESFHVKTDSSKTAILVVSFGTSYNDSREVTIGGIEKAIAEAFPGIEVRRAFTSQIIINKLKERDGLVIDNMEEALKRAIRDGVRTLVVQPTHMMAGFEYMELAKELKRYEDKFDRACLAAPLLTDDEDFEAVIKAVTEDMASCDDGETAICFMGHGTEAASNAVYSRLQRMMAADGHENYFIGTVEAAPNIENIVTAVKAVGKYKRVILKPLMVVAGDHANNDMAGDGEHSWKRIFEAEGFLTECMIEGLGQMPAIQDIYVAHTKAAAGKLAG